MSRYPDWVNQFKKKGTSVKKVGDSYYLYSNTSKYVKGKKYPQPVQHFIGVITHDGVIETHKQKVSLTDIEVYEYGFSTAVMTRCPQEWKDRLKKDWYEVLTMIILKHSPNSYIQRQEPVRTLQKHHNIRAQESKLEEAMGIKLRGLEELKYIYAVYIDKQIILSKISKKQEELLEKLGIKMGSEKG